jgi:hypothetical protein
MSATKLCWPGLLSLQCPRLLAWRMFNLRAVLGGLASALVFKWTFDRWLWDVSFRWLTRIVEFETAESVTAVLSYLVSLAAAALVYTALAPPSPAEDGPTLRRHPWQSPYLIVGLIVIVAATVAGLSYGRVFGLPSVTLPQSR